MRDATDEEAKILTEALLAADRPERVAKWPNCPDCDEAPSLIRYGSEIPRDFRSDDQIFRIGYSPCTHAFRVVVPMSALMGDES